MEHLLALANELTGPLQLIYGLHCPRAGGETGRYASAPMNHLVVAELFTRFSAFLEQDPRHILWLFGTADDEWALLALPGWTRMELPDDE